jgi:hypothetical protein
LSVNVKPRQIQEALTNAKLDGANCFCAECVFNFRKMSILENYASVVQGGLEDGDIHRMTTVRRQRSKRRKRPRSMIVTTMAVAALARTQCKPFHHSGGTVAQCHNGNRRRLIGPATELNRATVGIALPCTCVAEIHAAAEVLSTRGVRANRPQDHGSGGDYEGQAFFLAGTSRYAMARESQGLRCRQDEGFRPYTQSGRVQPAPSISRETC